MCTRCLFQLQTYLFIDDVTMTSRLRLDFHHIKVDFKKSEVVQPLVWECVRVCECECECECVCVCACACASAWVSVCVCVCECVFTLWIKGLPSPMAFPVWASNRKTTGGETEDTVTDHITTPAPEHTCLNSWLYKGCSCSVWPPIY